MTARQHRSTLFVGGLVLDGLAPPKLVELPTIKRLQKLAAIGQQP